MEGKKKHDGDGDGMALLKYLMLWWTSNKHVSPNLPAHAALLTLRFEARAIIPSSRMQGNIRRTWDLTDDLFVQGAGAGGGGAGEGWRTQSMPESSNHLALYLWK
jgi:hypothetical protein